MAVTLKEEEIVVVFDVTVEEGNTQVEEEDIMILEGPEMAAISTIVVTDTGPPPTCNR